MVKGLISEPFGHQISETSWIRVLEALEIPEAGKGLPVIYDGGPSHCPGFNLYFSQKLKAGCVPGIICTTYFSRPGDYSLTTHLKSKRSSQKPK